MFVANFDFTEFHYHFKFLLINIPVLVTQLVTYPLQRIQTQLISKEHYITKNQIQQSQHIFREMIGIQGFPKLWHGVRYSLDYTATQMTAKFFMFDYLMENINNQSKFSIYGNCFLANIFATVLSQSASNFQILASSLPVDSKNRNEDVKIKLMKYMKQKNPFLSGLKYTASMNIINTAMELLILTQFNTALTSQNQQQPSTMKQLGTIFGILLATSFTSHYVFQRQVQLCLNYGNKIEYTKGLLGTILRNSIKGLTLYGLYFWYFEDKAKSQIIQGNFKKQASINQLPKYRE